MIARHLFTASVILSLALSASLPFVRPVVAGYDGTRATRDECTRSDTSSCARECERATRREHAEASFDACDDDARWNPPRVEDPVTSRGS